MEDELKETLTELKDTLALPYPRGARQRDPFWAQTASRRARRGKTFTHTAAATTAAATAVVIVVTGVVGTIGRVSGHRQRLR